MNSVSQIKEIKKYLVGQILFDENLSKYSWFNIGGPAKILYKPNNISELSHFLEKINGLAKIKVLGAGSNTLIRDGGFNGIIIKLHKSFFRLSLLDTDKVMAGSSILDKDLSNFGLENSISGFEFLSCIPGSIGGGIRMNSGCYGEDISKILVSVQVMDLNGQLKVIYSSDIKFGYRECSLDDNLIFIGATFRGKKDSKLNIKKKIDNLVEQKKNDQPSKIKTCGSTFKNPKSKKAWKLIKESGCAGMSIGNAYISEKHCNFFVNKRNARSEDLEKLIYQVQNKVKDKTGTQLELELQIIGEKL